MIFLQILKIIGIILLVILGIILFVILLALFYPISYRIKGSYHKELQLEGKVSWLFHLLSIRFLMENQKQKQYFRILWFRKVLRDDFDDNADKNDDNRKKKNVRTDKNESRQEKEVKSYSEEDFFDDEPEILEDNPILKEVIDPETLRNSDTTEKIEDIKKQDYPDDNNVKKKFSIINKIHDIWNIIKQFLTSLWQKICSICKTIKQFQEFIHNPNHREAFGILKSEMFHLLKVICPSRMKLESTFSTGSPDRTGQALGILCLFPIAYQNRWRIYPDFESEEFYIEADFDVKGHVFLYQIIHIALKIVLNKNCRQLYNDIRK